VPKQEGRGELLTSIYTISLSKLNMTSKPRKLWNASTSKSWALVIQAHSITVLDILTKWCQGHGILHSAPPGPVKNQKVLCLLVRPRILLPGQQSVPHKPEPLAKGQLPHSPSQNEGPGNTCCVQMKSPTEWGRAQKSRLEGSANQHYKDSTTWRTHGPYVAATHQPYSVNLSAPLVAHTSHHFVSKSNTHFASLTQPLRSWWYPRPTPCFRNT
jgi:hypothetical protein